MTDSSGRVAVVTGASGGIGCAVALRLARDGFAVVATHAGNATRAQELVAEIVDVVVNSAGIMPLGPIERLGRPEDVAEVISFLAGPGGGWVNAQVLRANGGFA